MMRGWQEPAHIRCVLRRSINEQLSTPQENGSVAVAEQETEFGRTAGEPDRGQQRECLGQILEAGACAMEKMLASPQPEFPPAERLGLECVLSLYARPSLLLTMAGWVRCPKCGAAWASSARTWKWCSAASAGSN